MLRRRPAVKTDQEFPVSRFRLSTIPMNQTPPLSGSHLRTYHAIFQHPAAHNLQWHDVHALFRHIAAVEDEPNGNLKVTLHGQVLVLNPPRTKDVADVAELMALRHFLQRAEPAAPAGVDASAHWLLVIDHHEARLFRSEVHGAVPQRLTPHEPDRYFRHEQNSQNLARGKERPDPNSFFEPIAQALQAAGDILIFGTGTGSSNEMVQFHAWLTKHHPALAGRIIGSLVIDEHHLTEAQLLAKARDYYAQSRPVLT